MIISPCVGICIIDPVTGYCRGCNRTLEEISKWTHYSDEEAHALLQELEQRDPLAPESD